MSSSYPMALPFPEGHDLHRFLNLHHSADLEKWLDQTLTGPLYHFLSRPRKNLRDQIVQLGFSLSSTRVPFQDLDMDLILGACCAVLEIFHAGSLIIDDIEDGSLYRRGDRTLHRIYGLPLALNAGNWLYFLPFKIIEDLPLSIQSRAALIRHCNETLLRAHYGQAMDLGVPVDSLAQSEVAGVTLAAIELKSGVLTGLALKIGAVALGADFHWIEKLDRFGRQLGVALQMLDDVGCLTSSKNPEKRCEDLKLKRLGFVFSKAAELLPSENYQQLLLLIEDCESNLEEILALLHRFEVPLKAKQQAEKYLSDLLESMQTELSLSQTQLEFIQSIHNSLVTSYA